MSPKPLLDIYDATALLNLTTRRIHALVRSGKLPHVALPDGEVRFDEADLLVWISQHKQPGAKEPEVFAR